MVGLGRPRPEIRVSNILDLDEIQVRRAGKRFQRWFFIILEGTKRLQSVDSVK